MTSPIKVALATLTANLSIATALLAQQSTPPPATDYTPAAPGAISSTPNVQTGVAPATSVETSPGIPTPANRATNSVNPREVANAISGPSANTSAPVPSQRPILSGNTFIDQVPTDRQFLQRGELGVWLVENGGPGVEVRRITSGSGADQAGLQAGDIILQINGEDAASPHGVARMIRDIPAGETAVVQFWRNSQTSDVEVVLQPSRTPYQVGYRGDASLIEMNRAGSDLEKRTARLEEQLSLVMRELQQLRQEISHAAATSGTMRNDSVNLPSTNIDFAAPAAVAPPAATPPISGQNTTATFPEPATPPVDVPATDFPAVAEEDPFTEETMSDAAVEEPAATAEGAEETTLDDTSLESAEPEQSNDQDIDNATGSASDDSEDLFE